MKKIIEVETKTILRFWLVPLLIAAAVFLIVKAKTGLLIVGAAIFLALAIKPLARAIEGRLDLMFGRAKKSRRNLASILAYVFIVLIIGGALAIIGPTVVSEASKFITNLPETFQSTLGGWDGINEIGQKLGVEDLKSEITNALKTIPQSLSGSAGTWLASSLGNAVSAFTNVILVLILTLLFLLSGGDLMDSFWKRLKKVEPRTPVIRKITDRMAAVVSTYVGKQVLIALLDGVVVLVISLTLSIFFHLPISLVFTMALISATCYLIPMFGQTISCIINSLILLLTSFPAALIFAAAYFVYIQIEGNLISPKIQGNALSLPPVIVLACITIGVCTFGLLGAIIAVPIAACVRILIEELPALRTKE